jgi:hypothetical protein
MKKVAFLFTDHSLLSLEPQRREQASGISFKLKLTGNIGNEVE